MLLERNRSLRTLNTFGIDATAKYFAAVESTADFQALHGAREFHREKVLVLGGGSNLLFTGDFDGLVIKNSFPCIEIQKEDASHVWLRAGAGVVWHDLVLFCVERGLGGLENLSLIPGQVGAAPMQNIGAYGVEMEACCESVEALELVTGAPAAFSKRDCEFGYRDSVFKRRHKDRFLITAVTFRLDKNPHFEVSYGDLQRTLDAMGVTTLSVRAVSDAVIRIRTSKLPDPKERGNAGSFFKNPVVAPDVFALLRAQNPTVPHYPAPDGGIKVPAGWLIEQCGWKGRIQGQAGVHDRQALVLVNQGHAKGQEILDLAHAIQASVRERFGIDLTPEVNVI